MLYETLDLKSIYGRTRAMWPTEAASEARLSLEGYGAFFRELGPAVRLLDVNLLYPIASASESKHGNVLHGQRTLTTYTQS